MNPGVSFAITGVLPQLLISSSMVSPNSSPVFTPGTISTRGINGAGLKKWSPPKRSGCLSPLERAAILRLEVFVQSQALSEISGSTCANKSFFTSRFSITASTTRSAPETALSSCDQLILPKVTVRCSSSMRPFSTKRPKIFSIEDLLRSVAPGKLS